MLFQQMVNIVPDADSFRDKFQFDLGYGKWMEDSCVQQGVVWNGDDWEPFKTEALMYFNYDIVPNMVFEVIQYTNHEWLNHIVPGGLANGPITIMTQVVENLQTFLQSNWLHGSAPLIQRYRTSDHTNPYLTQHNRWFDHAVFGTRNSLGYVMKAMEKKYGHAA